MIKLQFLTVLAIFLITLNGFAQPAVDKDVKSTLSPEVQALLARKKDLVQQEIAVNPVIIKAVKEYNEKNKSLTIEEISKLDAEWQSSKVVSGFMKEFLTGPIAELLIELQDSHNGFVEMFITDAIGLNVAMTNRTSDYYQADEDWWVKCYSNGRGLSYYGNIEYDESAMSESIPIYVPIIDPQDKKVIGMMKTVVDITAIKMEL